MHDHVPTVRVFFVSTAVGLAAAVAPAQPLFVDGTVDCGMNVPHVMHANGAMTEVMAGGGVVADFDRDGDQDLFVIGGSGAIDRLYLNDGTGGFTPHPNSGLERTHSGTGAAAGDVNGDGHIDIVVTSLGPVGQGRSDWSRLYLNNGDATFVEATGGWAIQDIPFLGLAQFSPALGDFDRDGHLDLFVADWQGSSYLLRNTGSGFVDARGVAIGPEISTMHAFSPRFVDMDGDGWPELLVAADFGTSNYFRNDGGVFTAVTGAAGVGLESNGMGSAVGDVNNDGDLDWYVSSTPDDYTLEGQGSGNMLYMQTGPHLFSEVSIDAGVNDGRWGWGIDLQDFNHDGRLDIIETNGWVVGSLGYLADPSMLWLNQGDGTFTLQAPAAGIDDVGQGRGLLTADLDNDGDRDIVIFRHGDAPVVYFNTACDNGGQPDKNWVRFTFDTDGPRVLAPDGFGTRVDILAGGLTQTRYLDGGSNFLSQSELAVHFGLGNATVIDRVTITWADGVSNTLHGVAANASYTLLVPACAADLTTQGAGVGNLGYGMPDGIVTTSDIQYYVNFWVAGHTGIADITTQGAGVGDPGFGLPDGLITASDIQYYVNLWFSGCP